MRIAVVCALAVATVACDDGEEAGGTAANQPFSTDDPDGPDRTADTDEEDSSGDAGGANASQELTGEVLATATGADDSLPLRLELNAVRRQGSTVSITFGVTNQGDKRWQVAQFFSGPGRGDVDTSSTLAGVSLIDTVNGRRYPVLFGEDGVCACDSDLSGRFVGPGETGRFSALTGAPPREVDTVDVQIPGFGTFSAIPLADR